jgi:hypothetical protein
MYQYISTYTQKKIIEESFVVFLLLLINFSFLYGDISDNDGNDWNAFSESFKTGYVCGFMSASSYVVEDNTDQFGFISRVYKDPDKAYKIWVKTIIGADSTSRLFTRYDCRTLVGYARHLKNEDLKPYTIFEITVKQIMDGLDELYRDFKNRSIKMQDAIYVVKKQIKGSPEDEVEKILLFLRGDKMNFDVLYIYDKKGEVTGYIHFP